MGRIDYLHDPDAPPANSVVPSVVALVQNDAGEVLLIQRSDNGRWALPGRGDASTWRGDGGHCGGNRSTQKIPPAQRSLILP